MSDNLGALVRAAQEAVNGGSRDEEISALWDAFNEALRQLGMTEAELEES